MRGLHDQGPGDGDPLALAAGELVGIAAQERLRRAVLGQAHVLQGRQDPRPPLGLVQPRLVDGQALADDLLDGQPRRQGGEGILEHHLDVPAQAALALRGEAGPGLPVHLDLAGGRRSGPAAPGPGRSCRSRIRRSPPGSRPAARVKSAPCTAVNAPLANQPRMPGPGHRVVHPHRRALPARSPSPGSAHLPHAAAVDQLAGVGMLGRLHHLEHGPLLHQHPALHHRHPVGEAPHQVQVVGDHQHRQVALAPRIRSSRSRIW